MVIHHRGTKGIATFSNKSTTKKIIVGETATLNTFAKVYPRQDHKNPKETSYVRKTATLEFEGKNQEFFITCEV